MVRRILILTVSVLAATAGTALAAGARTAVAAGARTAVAAVGGTAVAAGGGTAVAAGAPTWNSGYNHWWPGGFGYAPVTVQVPTYPASVTAYGPTFHSSSRGWTMDYGAGTSSAHGVGVKTLTVSVQVLGQDGRTWYTLTGSRSTGGPASGNPLRLISNRSAYL